MARLSDKALDNRLAKIDELERAAAGIKDEIDALKDEIKKELDARGVDEVVTGKWKVSWKAVVTNRFDTAAFKKLHKKLYDSFLKPSGSMRFTKSALDG